MSAVLEQDVRIGSQALRFADQTPPQLNTPEQYRPLRTENKGELSNKVLAVDLSIEWDRIHEDFEGSDVAGIVASRRDRFILNVEPYLKEAYGVELRTFQPYRMDRSLGKLTLRVAGYNEPIREVYNPHNPNHPWPAYRLEGVNYQRGLIEYQTFTEFERSEALANAREGDTFIWISPPPMDIVDDPDLTLEQKSKQLEKLGYGFHTNIFALTVENGRLQGRVVKNFLRPEDHRKLLEEFTGKSFFDHVPTDLELLGTIAKIQPGLSVLDIQQRVQAIYDQTPEYMRITPPNEEKISSWLKEEHMNEILRQVRPIVEQTFYLLYYSDQDDLQDLNVRALIASRFQSWEKAVAALLHGDAVDLSYLQNLSSEELEQLALIELNELRPQEAVGYYQSDEQIFPDQDVRLVYAIFDQLSKLGYETPITGCGSGTGFGENIDIFGRKSIAQLVADTSAQSPTAELAMTYRGISSLQAFEEYNSSDEVHIRCPQCKNTHSYRVAEVQQSGKLQCRSCSNCTDCWEPIVAAARKQSMRFSLN